MISSCNVCISLSLVVALRIVSHVIDLVARDLRDDIEDDRIVSSTLSWYVAELQEPTVCTLPQVVMASVLSSGRGSFTGSPAGCRETQSAARCLIPGIRTILKRYLSVFSLRFLTQEFFSCHEVQI